MGAGKLADALESNHFIKDLHLYGNNNISKELIDRIKAIHNQREIFANIKRDDIDIFLYGKGLCDDDLDVLITAIGQSTFLKDLNLNSLMGSWLMQLQRIRLLRSCTYPITISASKELKYWPLHLKRTINLRYYT